MGLSVRSTGGGTARGIDSYLDENEAQRLWAEGASASNSFKNTYSQSGGEKTILMVANTFKLNVN